MLTETESSEKELYDVAILGSGFAGSMLGAILARNGAKGVAKPLDRKAHPKFAIGESTIPNMLVTLRMMAMRYDVPELLSVATFTGCQKVVSASHGQKTHFGFMQHQEGKPQDPKQLTMFNFPEVLLHPAAHMYRQDVDVRTFTTASRYGCTTRTRFHAVDVDFDGSGVTIASAQGEQFRARYVVVASVYRSPLAEKFALREDPCRYEQLHSRARSGTRMTGAPNDRPHSLPRLRADTPPVPWYRGHRAPSLRARLVLDHRLRQPAPRPRATRCAASDYGTLGSRGATLGLAST